MTAWQLTRDVYDEIRANSFLGRGSELAFDFLFALFPMILLMLTLFGLSASGSAELRSDFLSFFADFLPPAAYQLLKSTTSELAANAGSGKVTFGIIFSLWFASGGVRSMISALNLAYRVQEKRSWVKVRAIALGLTLMISILLFTALLLVLVSGRFVDRLNVALRFQPLVVVIWKAVQWPAAILFVLASYTLIYYFGPDLQQRRWHWITPGSALGGRCSGLWPRSDSGSICIS